MKWTSTKLSEFIYYQLHDYKSNVLIEISHFRDGDKIDGYCISHGYLDFLFDNNMIYPNEEIAMKVVETVIEIWASDIVEYKKYLPKE